MGWYDAAELTQDATPPGSSCSEGDVVDVGLFDEGVEDDSDCEELLGPESSDESDVEELHTDA